MELIAAVYQSLKRKKSAEAESLRLGISLPKYLEIKEIIINVLEEIGDQVDELIILQADRHMRGITRAPLGLEDLVETPPLPSTPGKVIATHEDLESGTSKITGIAVTEPRTSEEIIELLRIDTSKWKLSQYWNKEKAGRWEISALISKLPQAEAVQADFLERLQTLHLPTFPYMETGPVAAAPTAEKTCGVLSLQDLHFGKPGNEDMGQIVRDAVQYIIHKAASNYFLDKVFLILGPDTLNMDTFDGTTTKGTPVENSETATDAYLKAFDSCCEIIHILKNFCNQLEVIFIPGNHDRLSGFHLVHAVSQVFREYRGKGIDFSIDYQERKVAVYENNLFCFEHGDVTSKNNPLVYAVEHPKQWGATRFRTLYTGHLHGRKTKEFFTENEEHGFVTKVIPALTGSDYYHYHNKYVGNTRTALMDIHDARNGLIAQFAYNHV